ncbi:MAG: hypothetical protein AUK47_28960 [Deltaproteobacteria bacterium CG2_30_63_29]|nr:MAG: hypothetical protein AUK47_28960 [Deltaproteobacteria bacterium CG2_30_63_29]PIV98378.1 MAG: DNA-binding response regulator [Deltaproteobacteria bacterium CG17_big_fil_post_rev_8_21_14_2_50_63_7]PJB42944.1 MAG: DNA-binding response regulator [Deltaproteobacteria bacterium CG_4_9_14_3_um_filter_63_12]
MNNGIRTVIADDHVVLRVGLKAFLEEQTDPGIHVVGDSSTGEGAIELVQSKHADLLLLDLSMPGLGGIGTTLELRRLGSTVRILILTQYAEAVYARRALEAGANGYMLKTARGEELLAAIRAVIGGGTYIDPAVAGLLMAPSLSGGPTPNSEREVYASLTPRERQVLTLVAEGFSNKEIAEALDVAVKTAMAHRANMMDKIGIHNRSKLVQFAIRMGLVTMDEKPSS